jgi:hypothetical protein
LTRTTLIGLAAILIGVVVASWAGYICPVAVVRFAPYVDTLTSEQMLTGASCLEVLDPTNAIRFRITDARRIREVQRFLLEHSRWWGEHVFSWEFQPIEVAFRACGGAESSPKFTVGAARLGLEPGKGLARPLCRRDHDKLIGLLSPP